MTIRGLNEFQNEYIDDATSSAVEEEATTQGSGTTEDEAIPVSTVETTTCTTPTQKTCTLDKNQKKFVIFNPATFLTAPHKPKIQYIDREKIREFCEIGMEFLNDDDNYKNEEAMNEYRSYVADQNKFVSFDSFPGVSEFIQDILSADEGDFVRMLWNHKKRLEATGTTRTFMDIVCYTLTDFSSNCKQELRNSNNHERTPFVKYIVPMFKYLGQESNLTEFSWCEKMIESQGLTVSESNDFVISFQDRKYADGLGRNTRTNNEELFIECSSGFDKEITSHSLDDTLKLLVECSNSLLHILKQNKRASMETMTKKCTFGIQVIKQTLTVTKLNLTKSGRWRLVELRSACVPISWELRSNWNIIFEMLATLYNELLEQRRLDRLILDENCGLRKLPSKSTAEYFLN